MTKASRASGTPGFASLGRRGGPFACSAGTSAGVATAKGTFPVSIS